MMMAILSISSSSAVSENDFMHLSHGLNCDALLQEPIKRGANAQEHNDPEHRHNQSQSQTAREHQYMNEQNVDDDRSEQRQREGDVAINQEQDRRNDLEQKYRDQIMRDEERPQKLTSRSGRRRAGNEVEEAIQSEDEKDQAKKKTGDDSYYFHVSLFLIELKYIDINIFIVKSKYL